MERYGHITWEVAGNTGLLSLGPPPENLLPEPDFIPLETLAGWTSGPELKGIIIHGQGKHFSSGADMEKLFRMIQSSEDLEGRMNAGKAVLAHISSLDIPVIAAVQGVCFGGGLEVALACHIRICSENALFAFPESSHGLIPGLGGTVMISETARHSEAIRLLLSGDMINAEEALRLGIADSIVPRKELLPYCQTLLRKMTSDRPIGVIHAVMESLRNATTQRREDAMLRETELFCMLAKREFERRQTEGS